MLTKNVLRCTGTWHSRRAIVCNQSTALSTRMRFHLRTQLFVNGYGFRPHVPDENDRRKRNFSKRSPDWNFLKTPFSRVRVDRRKRNFSKTLRTHYQFQSTLRKNLLNMADERFPFLSFILGLISNLIACFQANLALLILQADYSRRRQNIIRLLSMPVSRGGRLDLPPV